MIARWVERLRAWWGGSSEPEHLRRGRVGEEAARRHLQRSGLRFLAGNVRCRRGEIDLVFREGDCLVFVEVKTRSRDGWVRPAAAVDSGKKRRVSRAALEYLRRLREPRVKVRFDIVEVLLDGGEVGEVRHLPGAFTLSPPWTYG